MGTHVEKLISPYVLLFNCTIDDTHITCWGSFVGAAIQGDFTVINPLSGKEFTLQAPVEWKTDGSFRLKVEELKLCLK